MQSNRKKKVAESQTFNWVQGRVHFRLEKIIHSKFFQPK